MTSGRQASAAQDFVLLRSLDRPQLRCEFTSADTFLGSNRESLTQALLRQFLNAGFFQRSLIVAHRQKPARLAAVSPRAL